MAIAFESKDVRRQTVQEETVMADDHGATGKAFQRFFECRQRFNVKIVCRFIEQQNVSTFFQHLRHMHPVAFTAGKQADLLLLIDTLEVERTHISARRGFVFAKLHKVGTTRNFFPYILVGIKVIAALVDKTQFDSLANFDFTRIGGFLSGYQLEQRRFTRTVRPDYADNTAWRNREGQVFEQQLVAVRFRDVLDFDDLAAEPFRYLDNDLRFAGRAVFLRLDQLIERLDPRLGLGLARLRALPDPVELVLDRLLPTGIFTRFLFEPLALLLEIG